MGTAGVSNTSNLAFGGDDFSPPTRQQALTEAWDGSAWSEVADLNSARINLAGAGTKTAALAMGGYDFDPNVTGAVEQWNGSAWTTISRLNTAGYGLAGTGTITSALAFGRNPPATLGVTEEWNGVSWVEVADLNAGRNALAGAGTTTAALAMGGTPPAAGATEEWSSTSTTIKVLTD